MPKITITRSEWYPCHNFSEDVDEYCSSIEVSEEQLKEFQRGMEEFEKLDAKLAELYAKQNNGG